MGSCEILSVVGSKVPLYKNALRVYILHPAVRQWSRFGVSEVDEVVVAAHRRVPTRILRFIEEHPAQLREGVVNILMGDL